MNLLSKTVGRRLAPWAALLFLLAASGAAQNGAAAGNQGRVADAEFQVTTVFLVRHAEKADEPGPNPPLSAAGRARAEALARALQSAGLKAVFTSQFLRTQQTAEPVAKRLGLTPASVTLTPKTSNPREVSEESIQELKRKVEAHAGGAVLVVGHSNSVPDLVRALGGDVVPQIDEKVFDDLFVVTVHGAGRAKVARLKYGS